MKNTRVSRRGFLYSAAVANTVAAGQSNSANPQSANVDACSFIVRNGRFHFGSSAAATPAIYGARLGVDANGRTLWSTDAPQVKWSSSTSGEISVGDSGRLELHFPDSGLVWTITFRRNGEQSATISSHIRNTSATPVKLGRCRLADFSDGEAGIDFGSDAEKTTWLVMSGWQAPSRVRKVELGSTNTSSRVVTQLYHPAFSVAMHLGFITFDRINTEHKLWLDERRQVLAGTS